MKYKSIYFFLFSAFMLFLMGCPNGKQADPTPENPEVYPDKIILQPLSANKDSTQITLKWSRLENPNFWVYDIYRTENKTVQYSNNSKAFEYIMQITDKATTTFTDMTVPYGSYFRYIVVARLRTNPSTTIQSNTQEIKVFSKSILENAPQEIFHNIADKQIIVFTKSQPSLSLYNYQTHLLKKVSIPIPSLVEQTNCYPAMGIHQGQPEIYIPVSKKILIYNAKTLTLTGEIASEAYENVSVNYFDKKLFVSGSLPVLQTYDRDKKQTIYTSNGGNWSMYRLFLTKNKISNYINSFAISVTSYPVQLSVLYFNDSGNYISGKEDNYHGTYDLAPQLCKVAPNGMYFITDYTGAMYNYDLTFKNYLVNAVTTPNFADFEFSDDSNLIYAAMIQQKSINVYDQNRNLVKTIPLTAYPIKLLKGSNNELIVAVSSTPFQPTGFINYAFENAGTRIRFERVKM